MFNIHDTRNIVIWGTGLDAVRCEYRFKNDRIDFSFFVTSFVQKETFHEKKVYSSEEINLRDFYVVIAVSYNTYPIIAKKLRSEGLSEFVDFVYYDYIGKKLVYLHGNCHMNVIQKYMESAEGFQSVYSFYHAPRLVRGVELRVEKEIFNYVDWWIHQDIRDNNRLDYKASDSYISSLLDERTNEIVVPNLYGLGKGFYPQNKGVEHNRKNESITNAAGVDNNGMFCTPDFFLDQFVDEGLNLNQILEQSNQCIISSKEVKDNFDMMIEKITCRERNWDIKVSEFILDNYKKTKMFYDAYHPTNFLLHFISLKILERLDFVDSTISCDITLDTHEEPVYPFVKKILQLEWEDEYMRKGLIAKKACEKMDFAEYVREYIWWCHKVEI